VQECISSTCDPTSSYKSSIFIRHVCESKLPFKPSKTRRNLNQKSSTLCVSNNLSELDGAVRWPLEVHIIHDFRDVNLQNMEYVPLEKRQLTSGFSSLPPPKLTTYQPAKTSILPAKTTITYTSMPTQTVTSPADATQLLQPTGTLTPGQSSGLSSATKLGIGLGVPLGVIVLALVIWGVYSFGKRNGRQAGSHRRIEVPDGVDSQLSQSGTETTTDAREKMHQLHVQPEIAELPPTASRSQNLYELPAGRH
jgi:hypothetical protein